MKVLTVDDDRIVLHSLRLLLFKLGYEALTAENGKEALEVLDENPDCQIVITDWDMPEMGGLELCEILRSGQFSRYIYIIMLTGNDRREALLDGLTAGADDFMLKPFDRAELTMRIRSGERIVGLEMREMAIFAMAKLVELRDNETGSHLERVRYVARMIAETLQSSNLFPDTVNERFCSLIYATSPLHDIGKIGIPDDILLKPGKLEPEEMEVMKTHTVLGVKTLDAALKKYPKEPFLTMARDIVASHHEKYDGSGYPEGLVGEAIPLSARIVALADVFDALRSVRPYKEAMPYEEAVETIKQGAGTHFDPQLVELFLAKSDRIRDLHQIKLDEAAGAA